MTQILTCYACPENPETAGIGAAEEVFELTNAKKITYATEYRVLQAPAINTRESSLRRTTLPYLQELAVLTVERTNSSEASS
jgi:hypothetical protein